MRAVFFVNDSLIMRELLAFLIVGVMMVSCNGKENAYPRDKRISDKYGVPKDSSVVYFPKVLKRGEEIVSTGTEKDESAQQHYSSILRAFNEPLLYNNYIGSDLYRFLWIRSFDKPVLITILKDGDRILLNTKRLDVIPRGDQFIKTMDFETGATDSVLLKSVVPKFEINHTKELEKGRWKAFEEELKRISFFNKSPITNKANSIDGAIWILESHQKDGYWMVQRHSPADDIRAACMMLIVESELEEEIY